MVAQETSCSRRTVQGSLRQGFRGRKSRDTAQPVPFRAPPLLRPSPTLSLVIVIMAIIAGVR